MDASVLVVKTVGYTINEAAAKLRAIGVLSGIKLISSDTSIAQLEALTAKVIATGSANIVSAGPQFATSRVVVGVMSSDIAQRQALYQLGGSAARELSNMAQVDTPLALLATTTRRHFGVAHMSSSAMAAAPL